MYSTKTKTLTAAVLAVPLLVGCGQNAEPSQAADAASSTTASAATASSAPSAVRSTQAATQQAPAATTAGSAAPTAEAGPEAPAPSATPAQSPPMPPNTGPTGPALPAVEDPCAGVCKETARFQMDHPTFGAMEIRSYERVMHPETAPQGKQPSYAVYRGDTAVDYVVNPDATTLVSFGPAPVIGDQVWDIAGDTPVDRYGNVYLSSSKGVTVISPTKEGYTSHGTIPEANLIPPFPSNPAGLRIDASGEPTILVKDVAPGGAPTGKTLEYTWDGSTFVQSK
ncbi:hypothetical protein [Kocuria rhizophila]|uniref:hypothetical protein n=1 Tax=Kocuria rhizophila TaxID=72000 RepID=UPI0034DAF05B